MLSRSINKTVALVGNSPRPRPGRLVTAPSGSVGKFNSVPGAGVSRRNDFEQGDVLGDPVNEQPEIIDGKIRNRGVVVANHHIDLNKPGFHSQDVRTFRLLPG